jgi:hypothetical protein
MTTATATANWFEVSKEGLAKLLARKGKEFMLYELIQNGWDTRARRVDALLESIPHMRGLARLVVEDDDPDGFKDLKHAFTLFAESEKKGDPTKRGRFNLGEKLVLALAVEATVASTKGTVHFSKEGREMGGERREAGSRFAATVRVTKDEVAEMEKAIFRLIQPGDVETTFNGKPLPRRRCITSFQCTLPTEIADEEGALRRTERKTTIEVHEVLPGEEASVYEMGIPVVASGDDRWHYNVLQKVPLNSDRDNVTPAYLRLLRTEVLNHLHTALVEKDAARNWIRDGSAQANKEALDRVMDLRFGKKRVIADPTDVEGTKLAVSKGYTVIHGGSLSTDEWDNVKKHGVALPAGQVTPSPKVLTNSNGEDKNLAKEKWTPGIKAIVGYAADLGMELLGRRVDVRVVVSPHEPHGAWYSPGSLTFNVGRLGYAWFEKGPCEEVDELLIHEFGHETAPDHLSQKFHDSLCKLGADLAALALTKPEFFRGHGRR